jgi:hypothetical protein
VHGESSDSPHSTPTRSARRHRPRPRVPASPHSSHGHDWAGLPCSRSRLGTACTLPAILVQHACIGCRCLCRGLCATPGLLRPYKTRPMPSASFPAATPPFSVQRHLREDERPGLPVPLPLDAICSCPPAAREAP